MLDILQVTLLVEDFKLFSLLVSAGVQLPSLGPLLRELHRSFELHLPDNELAVAQLADFSFEFHAVCVDASSREHSLLVETVLAVADATEFAKVHLRLLLEDVVIAALASSKLGLLSVRGCEEEYRVFVACRELVLAYSHLFL